MYIYGAFARVCLAGLHCCSLNHSQSKEKGEGKERKGGGEDGSSECHFIYFFLI